MADFIDDDGEEIEDPADLDYSKYIKQIFGYDRNKYVILHTLFNNSHCFGHLNRTITNPSNQKNPAVVFFRYITNPERSKISD